MGCSFDNIRPEWKTFYVFFIVMFALAIVSCFVGVTFSGLDGVTDDGTVITTAKDTSLAGALISGISLVCLGIGKVVHASKFGSYCKTIRREPYWKEQAHTSTTVANFKTFHHDNYHAPIKMEKENDAHRTISGVIILLTSLLLLMGIIAFNNGGFLESWNAMSSAAVVMFGCVSVTAILLITGWAIHTNLRVENEQLAQDFFQGLISEIESSQKKLQAQRDPNPSGHGNHHVLGHHDSGSTTNPTNTVIDLSGSPRPVRAVASEPTNPTHHDKYSRANTVRRLLELTKTDSR